MHTVKFYTLDDSVMFVLSKVEDISSCFPAFSPRNANCGTSTVHHSISTSALAALSLQSRAQPVVSGVQNGVNGVEHSADRASFAGMSGLDALSLPLPPIDAAVEKAWSDASGGSPSNAPLEAPAVTAVVEMAPDPLLAGVLTPPAKHKRSSSNTVV